MTRHLTAVLLLGSAIAFAAVQREGDANVVFKGKGPAGFRLEGKTSQIDISETADAFVFSVSLETVKTGIGLRDRHMREKFLETSKYPNAELRLPKSALTLPEAGKSSEGTATGSFTVHGQTQSVQVRFRVTNSNGRYGGQGTFPIDIRKHGISIPSYLGVTVKPDMEVAASLNFTRQ
ncbi:MAG: YceI family protein [Myxococcaceae bacterium]